jgi:hypothetical protein
MDEAGKSKGDSQSPEELNRICRMGFRRSAFLPDPENSVNRV